MTKPTVSHPDVTVYHKSFHDSFGDAVWFAQEAHRIQKPDTPTHLFSRCIRNAMLSSALAIECAANCCLDWMSTGPIPDADLERLRPLAKFDVFLMNNPEPSRLNRQDEIVQKAENLISIRNNYVHAKVTPKPYVSTDKGLTETSTSGRTWTPVGIPRSPVQWRAEHARKAVVALVDFLNYIFFVAGPFDDGVVEDRYIVAQILSSEIESYRASGKFAGKHPLHETGSQGIDDKLADEWGLDFAVLGILSFKDGHELIRPSTKLMVGRLPMATVSTLDRIAQQRANVQRRLRREG